MILFTSGEVPVSELSDRQPIVIDPVVYDARLDPFTRAEDVRGLLGQRIDSQCQLPR